MNTTLSALRFENLTKLGVPHCLTTRQWGSINPFVGYESLSRLEQGLGISPGSLATHIVFAEEVHGAATHTCVAVDGGSIRLGVDGLLSNNPALLLAIYMADCFPLFLYDPVQNGVAALHVGRRGALEGLIQAGLMAMKEIYGSQPKDVVAALGPGLRSCCYVVKEDIFPELRAAGWMDFLERRDGQYFLDLPTGCKTILTRSGVRPESVEDIGLCTACRADILFSARRRTSTEERGSSFCALISVHNQKHQSGSPSG